MTLNSNSTAKPRFHGIRLVVFDLDGTLVDAFQDITNAVNAMLREVGKPEQTLAQVKKHVGRGARMLVSGVLGTTDSQVIEEHLQVLMKHYHTDASTTTVLYEGVQEAIRNLRGRGIKAAVASNKPDPLTRKVLENLELAPELDIIHGQTEKFPCKPAPELLNHILEMANVTPQQTVVVGDTWVDIDFARAAGCHSIVVTYGQFSRAELEQHKPDALVDHMSEVIALIG